MLFSDRPRTHYEKPLAHEVICQLRFPSILTINSVEPADFQEAIRPEFPPYARRQDAAPPHGRIRRLRPEKLQKVAVTAIASTAARIHTSRCPGVRWSSRNTRTRTGAPHRIVAAPRTPHTIDTGTQIYPSRFHFMWE